MQIEYALVGGFHSFDRILQRADVECLRWANGEPLQNSRQGIRSDQDGSFQPQRSEFVGIRILRRVGWILLLKRPRKTELLNVVHSGQHTRFDNKNSKCKRWHDPSILTCGTAEFARWLFDWKASASLQTWLDQLCWFERLVRVQESDWVSVVLRNCMTLSQRRCQILDVDRRKPTRYPLSKSF